MVQLLAPYIDHESHSAERYRHTDGQTDKRHAYANSRSYCVAVQSAKKHNKQTKYHIACRPKQTTNARNEHYKLTSLQIEVIQNISQ